jgi:hypothetical protein
VLSYFTGMRELSHRVAHIRPLALCAMVPIPGLASRSKSHTDFGHSAEALEMQDKSSVEGW